jgi:predicted hotdog family 3-hydroxylacyl-ACP dehydratase
MKDNSLKAIDHPIENLLPHAPPMILLDRVEAYQDDFIHTSLTIRKDSPFLEEGSVPAYIALEYMAQTIAAWSGLIAQQQKQAPKIGFLLGTRRLVLDIPSFHTGETLDIYGRLNYTDGEIAAFDCWVEIKGARVVQASLNVFQPKEGVDLSRSAE